MKNDAPTWLKKKVNFCNLIVNTKLGMCACYLLVELTWLSDVFRMKFQARLVLKFSNSVILNYSKRPCRILRSLLLQIAAMMKTPLMQQIFRCPRI